MANNGLKNFKGIRGKLSLLGGFLVISADFAWPCSTLNYGLFHGTSSLLWAILVSL